MSYLSKSTVEYLQQEHSYNDAAPDVPGNVPKPSVTLIMQNHDTQRTSREQIRTQKFENIEIKPTPRCDFPKKPAKKRNRRICTCLMRIFIMINLLAVIGIGVVVWILYQVSTFY